jgi:hypothetical protein
MKRIRFNLRTLLIIIALVGAFLGYAQWRRQAIMAEARALESQGFTLLWQDSSMGWIWPVVPKEAKYEYYQLPDGRLKTASGVYSEEQHNAQYKRACDRLRALGVEEVRLDRDGKSSNIYTGTRYGPPPRR